MAAVTPADPSYGDRFEPVADARPNDGPWPAMQWPPPADVRLPGRVVEVEPLVPERDAEALFQALDRDPVWRHVAGRPQDADQYTAAWRQRITAGMLPWVVRLRVPYAELPDGTIVGTSSYLEVSIEDARLEIGSTAYRPDVWGTAVNPDTKLTLLAYAFEGLGAGRVQLKTDVRNVRSQEAIARLGATYEGTLRRYQRRADGSVRDTVLFSVVAEEWPAIRDGLAKRLDAVLTRDASR